MNEWLSWNMPLHALGGAAFLVVWKLVEEIPAVRKRMEWIAGTAILLAWAGGKENIDRELTGPAFMDLLSYVWLVPLVIWAFKWGPGPDCLCGHFGSPLHTDYPPGLRWIPRAWTSWCKGWFDRPPEFLFGSIRLKDKDAWGNWPVGQVSLIYPKAIPPRGHWQVSGPRGAPVYFGATTCNLTHVRFNPLVLVVAPLAWVFASWWLALLLTAVFLGGVRYTETADPTCDYFTWPAFTVKSLGDRSRLFAGWDCIRAVAAALWEKVTS